LVQSAHRFKRLGTNPGRDVRTIYLANTCLPLWGSIHPPLKSITRAQIKWRNFPLTSTQSLCLECMQPYSHGP